MDSTKISFHMTNYEKIAKSLMDSDSDISSVAFIEGKDVIAYTTSNWDISNEIEDLNYIWEKLLEVRITIAGIEYVIIQITPDRVIAANVDNKGSVIGIKDEEIKILCRVKPDSQLTFILSDMTKELWNLSSKEPYLEPDASLGRVDQLKWTTPRILLDDTNNLQELGLLKFGLSLEEAQVYLALLRKGKKGDKVGTLNEELDIKRTTIYRILDRLVDKEWIFRLPGISKGAQIFTARPLSSILDERIQKREDELKILKSFRFIMGESPENGWVDISEIDKQSKSLLKKGFDFKTLGITGEEKDCGLLIFEYYSPIEDDIISKAALQLSCERLKLSTQVDEDIEEYTNSDLEDLKFESTKIHEYLGAIMYLKFKEGSKTAKMIESEWIIAAKLVAIPMENKIYVIWGSEEKFPILMNIILKLY